MAPAYLDKLANGNMDGIAIAAPCAGSPGSGVCACSSRCIVDEHGDVRIVLTKTPGRHAELIPATSCFPAATGRTARNRFRRLCARPEEEIALPRRTWSRSSEVSRRSPPGIGTSRSSRWSRDRPSSRADPRSQRSRRHHRAERSMTSSTRTVGDRDWFGHRLWFFEFERASCGAQRRS